MDLGIVETIILVMHVIVALAVIGLILIQQGKGAEMGAGFGSGASSTVFGSSGSGSFLTKITVAIAIGFFLTSFALAWFAKQHSVEARTVGIPEVSQQVPVDLPVEETGSVLEIPSMDAEIPAMDSGPVSEVPSIEPDAAQD